MLPTLSKFNVSRTIGTLFKFLIAKILPKDISKILYFDSDIVINCDINELWKFKINSFPIAAVPEIESHVDTNFHVLVKRNITKPENYFNAGMFIMNLDRIRNEESFIIEGIKFRMENTDLDCTDQDIWNYCFSEDYLKLPGKFNTLVEYARDNNDFDVEDKILHYITSSFGKGFGLDMSDNYNKLWFKYFMKTPWIIDENSLGRVDAELRKILRNIYLKQKKLARDVSMMMSGKTRAFYVSPENLERVKNTFELDSDEEIILADDNNFVQKLIESMKKFADKKVFFIMTDDDEQYKKIIANLIEAGFIENKNFINARLLMVDKQGTDFNSYQLLKLL